MSEEERIDAMQPTDEPLDAGEAVAEEAFVAEGVLPTGTEVTLSPEQAIADAQEDRFRARAAWSLVDKELFAFLFANCLFFAGAVSSWSTRIPNVTPTPGSEVWGLATIRGVLILGIALYGFWTAVFNIWHRQMKLWPYLVNALLAEWVGIQSIVASVKGPTAAAMDAAMRAKPEISLMDRVLYPMGVVPPGAWALTLGGIIVFVVLIRGIMAGGKKVKARTAAAGETGAAGRRRR